MRWFRLRLRSRGVKIVSRRRTRVWLKECERIIHREFEQTGQVTPPILFRWGKHTVQNYGWPT